MSGRKPTARKPTTPRTEAEDLIHALRTHQVDAVVGERHVMLVRLKQAEQNLANSRDQLRALTTSLQVIRENERAVIARDIHDELGQSLTSLQLGLSWLARKVSRKQEPLLEKIGSLSALATSMIQSVRRIADELRPGVLDELGLVKSLKSGAREFSRHTGISCRFESKMGKAQFNRAGSVAIFRIAQEALTNVARHAAASGASVTLVKNDPHLILTVTDNGKGINQKRVSDSDSVGLIGMRERAVALDGTLSVSGSAGRGTRLTVRLPLARVLISS